MTDPIRSLLVAAGLVTSVYAGIVLWRGHLDWARLKSRKAGGVVLAVAAALVTVGWSMPPDGPSPALAPSGGATTVVTVSGMPVTVLPSRQDAPAVDPGQSRTGPATDVPGASQAPGSVTAARPEQTTTDPTTAPKPPLPVVPKFPPPAATATTAPTATATATQTATRTAPPPTATAFPPGVATPKPNNPGGPPTTTPPAAPTTPAPPPTSSATR